MSEGQQKVLKGAAWMGSARALNSVIGFASTIILARLLLPDDFGIVAIAEAVAVVVMSITDLSLAQALVQHREPSREHYDTAWTLNVARSLLLAALLVLMAFPAAEIYGDPRIIPLLSVIAVATVVGGLENPRLIVFQRQLVFWQEFVLTFGAKFGGFLVAIAVAVAFRSYWALVLGSLASQLVRVLLSYILISYRPRFRTIHARELMSFSVWLTLSRGVRTLNLRSDPLALAFFVGADRLGHYSMGSRLAYFPVVEALSPLRQVLFPAFARMQGDLPRLKAAYLRAQGHLCLLGVPIAAGFVIIAEPAVLLLIGAKWLPAVPILQVLAAFSILAIIESSEPLAMALGRTKAVASRDIRVALIRLPSIALGLAMGLATPVGPLMGVVYGRVISTTINLHLNAKLVEEMLGLSFAEQFKPLLRPLVATGAMVLALLILRDAWAIESANLYAYLTLTGAVIAAALFYVLVLSMLWVTAGRPTGAEHEVAKLLGKLRSKSTRWWQ